MGITQQLGMQKGLDILLHLPLLYIIILHLPLHNDMKLQMATLRLHNTSCNTHINRQIHPLPPCPLELSLSWVSVLARGVQLIYKILPNVLIPHTRVRGALITIFVFTVALIFPVRAKLQTATRLI